MKNFPKSLIFGTTIYLLFSCTNVNSSNFTLKYVPFELIPYNGMSPARIDKDYLCIWKIIDNGELAIMFKEVLSDRSYGGFDKLNVHLKISGLLENSVFIDVNGGVFSYENNNTTKINANNFQSLKELINKLQLDMPCEALTAIQKE